jgi:7-carboxy-7-deazaguanine synthase
VCAHIASETPSAAGHSALAVAEVFGPTFQGEGPSIGRRCSFVRLSGCNLRCTWCDTPYTWDWTGVTGRAYRRSEERRWLDPDAIFDWVASQGTDMVVITGGEPLLQQRRLIPLVQRCAAHGLRIEVETAGTLSPVHAIAAAVAQFNVSPKLANSANPLVRRYRPAAIEALQATGKAVWKFVVVDLEDLVEIEDIVTRHELHPVYVMPEGISRERLADRTSRLSDHVLGRGWNLTTRLHILVYGNQRGV